MEYHIMTFGGIVALYWLPRMLMGKRPAWQRFILPELFSQGLFIAIYLFVGIRYRWDIFLLFAPIAGLWISYLCFAIDGAVWLKKRQDQEERTMYRKAVFGFLVLPVAMLVLPPMGRLLMELFP